MKITESPINAAGLTKITQLTGGNKGVLFLLENAAKEKLVVKFQNEDPVEALAGTQIMQRAEASTPNVRQAAKIDVLVISDEVRGMHFRFKEECAAFADAKSQFKYVLLMDFAEGSTLMKVRRDHVEEFFKVLCDVQFAQELGKILAADAFAGNPDRMFGGKIGYAPAGLEGWYHEQNLFVTKDAKPVAIDNAFRPMVTSATLPWGRYVGGHGIQWGSVAPAYETYAMTEAGLLFDKFLSTALSDHPDRKDFVDKYVRPTRAAFVANVAKGAKAAMQQLLAHGQHWAQSFKTLGAEKKLLDQFRVRKRLLRLIAAGKDPAGSYKTAQNPDEYRKWFLTEELKLSPGEADKLLLKGVEEYKKLKKQHLRT
jgi:hypothetical protein